MFWISESMQNSTEQKDRKKAFINPVFLLTDWKVMDGDLYICRKVGDTAREKVMINRSDKKKRKYTKNQQTQKTY